MKSKRRGRRQGLLSIPCWGLAILGLAASQAWDVAGSPPGESDRTAAAEDRQVPEDTFHFAIVSDNGGGTRPGIHASAIQHLARMRPDFVISVGDLIQGFDDEGGLVDAGKIDRVRDAFDAELEGLGVPYFYVSGNNDNFTGELHADWRARYGPTYYSFVHRDTLFVVLDSDDPPATWSGGIGERQLAWLEGVLAEHPDVVWTLLFLHRPLWLENADAWRPVEAALGERPRTVFAGHWHSYFRGELNGFEYYVLATTGGSSALSGPLKGSFDHVVWVAMTPEGPRLTNLHLAGVWDRDPVASVPGELTTRIRREGVEVAKRLLASGGPDPGDPKFGQAQMIALGRELAFKGRLDDAVAVLRLAVAGYPDSWRGLVPLADVQRLRGEPEKARQLYQRTLELLPAHAYAREQLEELSE